MIGFRADFQHLQLNVSTQRREEMVALCRDRFRRRLRQRSILLERLVVGFHVPSFAIDCGDLVIREVEIAGDQIQDSRAAVCVCEDLFDQMEREVDPFQINGHNADQMLLFNKSKVTKMDEANFPIEFNNEVDDVKKSENEFYTLAVDRLSKLAEGHTDISGAVVNFKQPAQQRETAYTYEVTIVVYMGSEHIAATENGEQFRATLDGALDAVERQVRERRKQQRNY